MIKTSDIKNHIMNINVIEPSPIMNKLYKLSIENPDLRVPQILELGNVTYSVYNRLCKNLDNIPQYRKLMLGAAYKISDEHRNTMLANMARGKLKKALLKAQTEGPKEASLRGPAEVKPHAEEAKSLNEITSIGRTEASLRGSPGPKARGPEDCINKTES